MKKKFKKKIVKNNPKIDTTQLDEVLKLMKDLQNYGVRKQGYNIVSPFSHKQKFQVT